ncbi:MAG TPA: glycosyltransferase family 4 protein [Anaerolineales bacterium]|nr:glycosyltransferase family 4 protein [Anaerolineales bacterium]
MRIGLVIYGSLENLSGGYLYDRRLVAELEAHGDQIKLVTLPWRSYVEHLADNASGHLHLRLQRLDVDLLLQDELNHPSLAWLNSRLKTKVAYPIVSIVHHLRSSEDRPAWQNRCYALIEDRYLNSVDGFLFNSQTTRQVVESRLNQANASRIRWSVAYPGGDQYSPWITGEAIRARALEPGPLRLLFVGNVIARKGLHRLLRALREIPWNQWELRVAGRLDVDKRYARNIRKIVALEGLVESVRFLDHLSPAQLAAQMMECQVLVVPSTYEGFGIAYLEGMGSGMTPIATTSGAAGEFITHNENGFVIPPKDKNALVNAIRRLIHDRNYLAQLSLAARARYLAHPTWSESMTGAVHFLHSFASQPPSRTAP